MSETETIQEFVSSRGVKLEVGNGGGVIKGVKVLGMESVNGRSYPKSTLEKALPLYADAKVNVNHPKGSAATPRDYQDRLGMIRDPVLRDDGIYGDLYYNPNHAIAKQMEWDAEHSPENMGLSHNVAAQLSQRDGRQFVENISRVLSVDLVADPATTRSLFESQKHGEDDMAVNLQEVTIDELRKQAPKLVEAIEAGVIAEHDNSSELKQVTAKLAKLETETATLRTKLTTVTEERDALQVEKSAKQRNDAIEAVLSEAKIPADILTEDVRTQAHSYADVDGAKQYIATLEGAVQRAASKPQSVEQMLAEGKDTGPTITDGKTLVDAISD